MPKPAPKSFDPKKFILGHRTQVTVDGDFFGSDSKVDMKSASIKWNPENPPNVESKQKLKFWATPQSDHRPPFGDQDTTVTVTDSSGGGSVQQTVTVDPGARGPEYTGSR